MNCVERFSLRVAEDPSRCALWMPHSPAVTYQELQCRASGLQVHLRKLGIKPGDPVLLLLGLGTDLYASVIALLALGCPILLLEPWMPVHRIEHILRLVGPKAFITNNWGRLWGLQTPGIRSISHWISPRQRSSTQDLILEDSPQDHPGILTFTSGTTGRPKGIVRSHGYLLSQHQILERHLHPEPRSDQGRSDWCIFANFALANLASGRTTVLMPQRWKAMDFRAISELPDELAPRSLTCGPAFLGEILSSGLSFKSLESVHVGGALTDCALFERAFVSFPETHFTHVYGSTEAEPVATVNARAAVRESRNQGFLQTLCLGSPVPEIDFKVEDSGLWVTGAHVCPRYLASEEENQISKKTDLMGRTWHHMGDRVRVDAEGRFWYSGRSFQSLSDFNVEQRIYPLLGHTSAFVHRDPANQAWLIGDHVVDSERAIRRQFPEIHYIENAPIQRDARHRARIDRPATLKRGAPWLVG